MRSGESEAQKSRYTSDKNVAWLQMGAFLITLLKIWLQNASGFRRYSNYPREVTALAVMCWPPHINPPHTHGNHSDSVSDMSESHSHQI